MAHPKLSVEVSADLVERATQRNSQHCMIAEAVKRADPENRRQVWVDLQTIRYTDTKKKQRIICLTPPVVGDALVAFDRGEPIEPFAFDARIIQRTAVRVQKKNSDGTVTTARRGRKKWRPSQQVIAGGDIDIPKAHLGGTDVLEGAGKSEHPATVRARKSNFRRERAVADHELQEKVERGEITQVEASSQRYRRYGLRLLKE